MGWSRRYAAESHSLSTTPPELHQYGNRHSDVFLTRNGDMYFQKPNGGWNRHIMGTPGTAHVGNLSFSHPSYPNAMADHAIRGWEPNGDHHDKIALLIHSCDDRHCNQNAVGLVMALRSHFKQLHGPNPKKHQDYTQAWKTASELTDVLLKGAAKHHKEYGEAKSEAEKDAAYDKFWSHVNTVNSIWNKPLGLIGQKYSVTDDDYRKMHEDLDK